jgi:hypothetical protein
MTADLVPGDGLFPPAAYARDDDGFYVLPREVAHIDDAAIGALGRLDAEVLPAGGRLLDPMSTLPSGLQMAAARSLVIEPARDRRDGP